MSTQIEDDAHLNTHKGLLAWFARNSVAANLLMGCIILAGLMSALQIRKQMFPAIEINWINIDIVFRGAAPQEVEETITVKLEEALASVQVSKCLIVMIFVMFWMMLNPVSMAYQVFLMVWNVQS